MKREQLNMRLDDFYSELLEKMMKKSNSDKSKVTRAALMYYAHYLLDDDDLVNLQMKYINKI